MNGRRTFLIGGAAWSAAGLAYGADPKLSDILGAVVGSQSAGLSQGDASSGIKAALSQGVIAATTKLGHVDGFFKDGRFHIPLPGTLGKAQKSLRPFGMSAPLDDLELKMNRSAENSMPAAKTMFLNAVKSITIQDAIGIVRGGDDSGTQFLRGRTEGDLTKLLRPKMKSSLQTTGAFGALDSATRNLGSYGAMLGGGSNINATLKNQVIDFAVTKTLDGAFGYIADEERDIRHNPVKRTTEILKKVFG